MIFKPRDQARLFYCRSKTSDFPARSEVALHRDAVTLVQVVYVGGTRPPGGFDRGMPDYPERLSHSIPSWVKGGAIYHIRIRINSRSPLPLTDPALGPLLLESARIYHQQERWNCSLFLLMPDHLHALIQFPLNQKMGNVVSAWKRYQARQHGIRWQTNFFDHRIRSGGELNEKAAYILRNPVVGNLCGADEAWSFVFYGSP